MKLSVLERLFWKLGTRFSGRCRCREVAVIEIGLNKKQFYGLSTRTKISSCCRKVAVMESGWPLVKV